MKLRRNLIRPLSDPYLDCRYQQADYGWRKIVWVWTTKLFWDKMRRWEMPKLDFKMPARDRGKNTVTYALKIAGPQQYQYETCRPRFIYLALFPKPFKSLLTNACCCCSYQIWKKKKKKNPQLSLLWHVFHGFFMLAVKFN